MTELATAVFARVQLVKEGIQAGPKLVREFASGLACCLRYRSIFDLGVRVTAGADFRCRSHSRLHLLLTNPTATAAHIAD